MQVNWSALIPNKMKEQVKHWTN